MSLQDLKPAPIGRSPAEAERHLQREQIRLLRSRELRWRDVD